MIFEVGFALFVLVLIVAILGDIYEYFENAYHKSTKNIEKLRREYDDLMEYHQARLKLANEWWHSKWRPSKEIPKLQYICANDTPDNMYRILQENEWFGQPGVNGIGIDSELSVPSWCHTGLYKTTEVSVWDHKYNHVKHDYWPDYQQLLYVDKWGRTFGWDQWEKMNLTMLRERKVVIEQKLTEAEIRMQRLDDDDEYSGRTANPHMCSGNHNYMVITMQEGLARINSVIDRKVERMNRQKAERMNRH